MSSKVGTVIGSHTIITSLRDFARDASIRNKALEQNKALIVENRRKKDFFVLFPSKYYDKLYEIYEDMRDYDAVEKEIAKNKKGKDWKVLEKELDKKFNLFT